MNRHRTASTLLGTFTASALLATVLAAPASARIVERDSFHDEFSGTIEDFCDVEGLDVDFQGVVDGRFQVNDRGAGYFMEHTRVVQVFMDANSDMTVTDIQPGTVNKDLMVTDNGDGTLTIIALLTGGQRTYGHEGNLIAKNSGQVRFEILYDVEADEEISSEVIFGSTGTNDDFCGAVLTDWGYL
jgi:hypothetical protein